MRLSHRALLAVVALIAGAAIVGVVALWPSPGVGPGSGVGPEAGLEADLADAPEGEVELVPARLLDVTTLELGDEDPTLLPGATIVEITAETADGDVVAFEMTDDTGDTFAEGQRVRLAELPTDVGEPTYYIADFQRGPQMVLLAGLFVLAVVGLGRFQGVRALLGLGLSFLVIIGFIVPAILDGSSPVAVALFGALVVMIVTLYLSHGANAKTSAAVVGTAGALLLTVALAAAFVAATSLTGFTDEEARLANFEVGGLSLRGLLLAGIIIGGLGVLDDVTMSQSATVFALRRADPRLGFAGLFRAGLSVGRDHVAATVNTLFLAYAGAALPLLILFTTGVDPLGTVVTSEIVAVEVVRTLVGSIGLVAAVPLTTALAAAVALETDPADVADAPDPHAPHVPDAPAAPAAPDPHASHVPDAPAEASAASAEAAGPDPDEDDERWVERLRHAYGLEDRDRG